MLLLKESSMNDQSGASTTFENSSSSPTILMASKSSDNKDRYKFIHDHRNKAGLTSKPNSGILSSVGRHTAIHNTYPTTSWTRPGSYQAPLAQQPNPAHFAPHLAH
nr:hypothetical protein [Tanacetum cinerariifolium]